MTIVEEVSKTEVKDVSIDSWSGLLMEEFLNGDNAKPKVSLTLEKDGSKYRFDLNVTNSKFVRDVDLKPSGLSGKDLTIKKVNVMNPTTQQEVEGLRICKIE